MSRIHPKLLDIPPTPKAPGKCDPFSRENVNPKITQTFGIISDFKAAIVTIFHEVKVQ